MTSKITIGRAGRVVIPKPVRDELHLAPGDSLEIESTGEQIVLRPVRPEGRFYKKGGFSVYECGQPITLEETNAVLRAIREERDAQNMGLR